MAKDLDLHRVSFFSKLLPIPGLVVSTAAAALLAMQTERDNTALYTFVTNNRTAVQVGIQIIAHALGFIEIFTLTSIVNFSTRLRLSRGSVSLAELRLWQSISSIRMAWSMPLLHLTILIPYIVFHLLPSALWAGAITPIVSSTVIYGSIRVPVYGPDPDNEFWNHTSFDKLTDFDRPVTRNSKGVFSYTTAALLQGFILNAAATATSGGGPHMNTHPKNDNSGLTYVGRSFGVGSSAGLEGPLPNSQFNPATMTFNLEYYATLGLRNDSQIVALAGPSHVPSNIFAIATGNGSYNVLDKVQCEVHFTPFMFDVFVNMTSLAITVTPLASSTVDMDPTSSQFGPELGAIPQNMMRQVTFLSMMNTNLYTSALGAVLSTIMEAISTSLESMVDDILVAYGSAQLEIGAVQAASMATETPTQQILPAMRIGSFQYVVAVVAVNVLVVGTELAEWLGRMAWPA
ncbi:hypothetical protein DFH07DRAFT_954640 [Mycena maculata]|uniref:Transmembrane protein n=1 Tax=Mycena maculata TaxID=230809 RepID=A0AAD7JQ33_9AGAR|nr:hypothetical protein DFH07DRAFT_954640 [Mycena maculata]